METNTDYNEESRNLIVLLNIGDVNMRATNYELSMKCFDELLRTLEVYEDDQELKL